MYALSHDDKFKDGMLINLRHMCSPSAYNIQLKTCSKFLIFFLKLICVVLIEELEEKKYFMAMLFV